MQQDSQSFGVARAKGPSRVEYGVEVKHLVASFKPIFAVPWRGGGSMGVGWVVGGLGGLIRVDSTAANI